MPIFDYPIPTSANHPSFTHPEVQYWYPHWQSLRDANMGQVEIKRKSMRYLPKLQGMEPGDYNAYLDRAVYFNMTSRTLVGLIGTLFRRNAKIDHLPSNISLSSISKEGQPLDMFVQQVAREIFLMGRYGVLLDMDEAGERPPYLAGYLAENLVDWTVEEIDGRYTVVEVILRELRLARPLVNQTALTPAGKKPRKMNPLEASQFSNDTSVSRAARRWVSSYRVLRLENEDPTDPASPRIYRQYIHENPHGDAYPSDVPTSVVTPTWRGQPFPFIPFVFFGPYDCTPDIEKSPLLDVVLLNLSHYRSYAQLEHGRFYTALPVYYCPVNSGQERGQYTIGPAVVWETSGNEKPGIIEFNGSGLKFLENALKDKESQIATLGGRMVDPQRVSTGESNNQVKVKEANENALLLNVAQVIDHGFTSLLCWMAQWQDVDETAALKISYETNKDFLLNNSSAREFRAIQMMYQAGVIPVEVLFDYLRRAEVIPDWLNVDEFKTLLSNTESFPNQVDVHAHQEGAPNAQSVWDAEHVLVDPAVVAVRGFDSQAPLGQDPLPGQTQGGKVTADDTAPPGSRPDDMKLQADLDIKKAKAAPKPPAPVIGAHPPGAPRPAGPSGAPPKPAVPKK